MSAQLVNAAVAFAVRRILDAKSDVVDRHSLGQSIGKRVQGTYGAALRRMADSAAGATAEDLYNAIIAPVECPWDSEAIAAGAARVQGARDRARARNFGPFLDDDVPVAPDLVERMASLRECVADEPGPRATPAPAGRDPWLHEMLVAVKAGDADAIARLSANAEKSAHARTKAAFEQAVDEQDYR